MEQNICEFHSGYFDPVSNEPKLMTCELREHTPGKHFCIFHDPEYLKYQKDTEDDHSSAVEAELIKRIEKSQSEKIPLICVGYHLPSISITEKFHETVIDI